MGRLRNQGRSGQKPDLLVGIFQGRREGCVRRRSLLADGPEAKRRRRPDRAIAVCKRRDQGRQIGSRPRLEITSPRIETGLKGALAAPWRIGSPVFMAWNKAGTTAALSDPTLIRAPGTSRADILGTVEQARDQPRDSVPGRSAEIPEERDGRLRNFRILGSEVRDKSWDDPPSGRSELLENRGDLLGIVPTALEMTLFTVVEKTLDRGHRLEPGLGLRVAQGRDQCGADERMVGADLQDGGRRARATLRSSSLSVASSFGTASARASRSR